MPWGLHRAQALKKANATTRGRQQAKAPRTLTAMGWHTPQAKTSRLLKQSKLSKQRRSQGLMQTTHQSCAVMVAYCHMQLSKHEAKETRSTGPWWLKPHAKADRLRSKTKTSHPTRKHYKAKNTTLGRRTRAKAHKNQRNQHSRATSGHLNASTMQKPQQ